MNKRTFSIAAATLGLIVGSVVTSVASVVLLNDEASVQQGGSYLYFSAASGVSFLSEAYYPGGGSINVPSLLRPDSSHTPGSISFGDAPTSWIGFDEGYLTDNNPSTTVAGWQGYTTWHTGSVNTGPYVLFDLGEEYSVDHIDVVMSDSSGQRWNTALDAQQVWTAASLSATPGTGTELSKNNSYWTQQDSFTYSGSNTYTISLSGAPVRYILLQLYAGTVDSRNTGGIINDVNVYGSIPEPSSSSLLLSLAVIASLLGWRRLRK